MTVTLLKTIPSNSHNAPYSPELGEHWPAGQQFELLNKKRQDSLRKFYHVSADCTCLEQIGGEEVIISIPNSRLKELFNISQCKSLTNEILYYQEQTQ
jgi:hypothetical protein